MTRNFSSRPVAPAVVERIVAQARRAPAAGGTKAMQWRIFDGEEDRAAFWSVAADPAWREDTARSAVLTAAPVILLPLVSESAYDRRYAQPDKSTSRYQRAGGWPVPYWFVDAGMAAMLVLLATEAEGLGALFFSLFEPLDELRRVLRIGEEFVPIGAIALGHRAGSDEGR